MTFAEFLFWTVGLLTCLSAIMVVATQNIVRAAVWLLFTLGGVAGLFFLLGADFLGAVQLIVYVGGILILVIFGVMLTAQGPFVNLKTSAGETVLAMIVGLLMLGVLASAIFVTPWNKSRMTPAPVPEHPATSPSAQDLALALLGFEQAMPKEKLTIPQPADSSRIRANPEEATEKDLKDRKQVAFLLPFEIVSVHLVVVLIGAAYLARAKRRKKENA